MKLLDQLGLQYLIEKFKERFDLKQDKLTAGDNITIDNNVISASDDGSVVDLGTFNDETELITHVVMNQLPVGHYTFIMNDAPIFMLLERGSDRYIGTFHDTVSTFYYFNVSFLGEIIELKEIDLRDLDDVRAYVDGQDLLLMDYVNSQDDLKADITYVDGKVQTDVPSGAKFTDTITTINGKTGAISKADIVALGIPSQDTVYSHPSSHPASMITQDANNRFVSDAEKSTWSGKSNFSGDYNDLSNKPTIQDTSNLMPISGGVLENYTEKLTTVRETVGTINLSLGNVFEHTPSGNRSYSITNAVNGQAHSFTLIIHIGSTVRTLWFPASVKWQGGVIPDMTTPNKTYVLTFMTINGGTTWLGMFGGEF